MTKEQIAEAATKAAEIAKAKQAEASRKGIFGGDDKAPQKKDLDKLYAQIRNMPLSKEVRELAGLSNDFEMTKKWMSAIASHKKMGDRSKLDAVQTEIRSMVEGTDSAGGYLVPTEFAALIMLKKVAITKMRRFASVIPMNSDTLSLPVESTYATATWEDEDTESTETDAVLANVDLVAYKLKALMKVTEELLDDANVSVIEWLAGQLAKVIATEEDKQFFTGNGTKKPTGLRSLSGVTSVTQASTSLAYGDALSLYMALPEQYRMTGTFVTSANGIKLLMGIVDDNGRPIFMPSFQEGKPATLFGRPIIEVADWPDNLTVGSVTNTTEIWFGDLSYYIVGDRMSLTIDSSDQRYWDADKIALKARIRVDGKGCNAEAFRKLVSVK